MTVTAERMSAKIYQFPIKARVVGNHRSSVAAMDIAVVGPRIEYGSSRYHDAAIVEDAQKRRRDGH